jgi:DNA-binding transcriptional regulator YhcF (GntR family)
MTLLPKLVTLDAASSVAPYEQVRTQLAAAIESGALAAETKLPAVRALAADLGLAVNTVARAYRELELAGYVETRGRNGTVVAGRSSRTYDDAVAAARTYVQRMRDLGIGAEQGLAIVRREIERGD